MIDTDFEQLNQKDMIQGAKEARGRTPRFKQIVETDNQSEYPRLPLQAVMKDFSEFKETAPHLVSNDRLAYLEKRDKELAELLGDNLHAISTDRLTYFQKRDKVLTELEAYLK